jgi:cysteine desulfurase
MIYLDHNSTTPLCAEAAAAILDCYRNGWGNPASSHEIGRRARRVLEEARDGIGRLLGADLSGVHSDRVIFTSGGTEANNLAIFGLAGFGLAGDRPGHGVISAIEHPSVSGPAEQLARRGWRIDRLPVTNQGVVRLDMLAELLRPDTRFVSLMLANNETGVLQPIAQAGRICYTAGVPLHTDAAQAIGKIPIDFRALGVSVLTGAGHKFSGPLGVGVLVCRPEVTLNPVMFGGFQQQGLRPGTESVALAVGMHAALAWWDKEPASREDRLGELRDSFEQAILDELPDVVVNGVDAPRVPQTSNLSFLGLDRQALWMALDMASVACSTGSACASGSQEPSSVLRAMGLAEAVVASALRFSVGRMTTAEEVGEAARRIIKVVNQLRSQKTPRKSPSKAPAGSGKTL